MARKVAAWPPRLWRVEFQRGKYGRELLVDAAFISRLPAFKATSQPHTLAFFDILLVTKGRGTFQLDDERHDVKPGVVLFTRPGQIRRWDVTDLDGACLFFANEFVLEAFADARFLDQFAFFRSARPSGALVLTASERAQFLRRFRTMSREFAELRSDASHLLRARLYELLVLLNRWYGAWHPAQARRGAHGTVERFQDLVEHEFRRSHRVDDYAAKLRVSPGHLSVLCKNHLGHSASREIHGRLLIEAKRLLLYTDKPAFAVARELGFADPAYFGRFFKRAERQTPRAYRVRRAP